MASFEILWLTATKTATRYGFLCITALALLSLTHWARNHLSHPTHLLAYLLGVLPNFLAAIAIPFFLISVWADQKKVMPSLSRKRAFVFAVIFSATGLILWEFSQQIGHRLVFDPNDIGATLVGSFFAFGAFHIVTPRTPNGSLP